MIHAALIGAGARGMNSLGSYALKRPQELKFIAVAEPNEERRKRFAKQHNIPKEHQYESWEQLLDQPKLCEALFICTNDDLHYEPTIQALDNGYHVLLEKPMSPKAEETLFMAEHAKEKGKLLLIGHVLRYAPFFKALKEVIDQEKIGRIINIQWTEHVAYAHHAHSYIRGNWRNSNETSPMILAKSCHDTDLINWIVDDQCQEVSSFGNLTYFKEENAPEGSTDRCVTCPIESDCSFSAIKQYYNEKDTWPNYMVSLEPTLEARWKALENTDYGRCVWRSDNNVVDHQVVNMQFANETTVSFTMVAFSARGNRTFNIKGTHGEIIGDFANNKLEIRYFSGKEEHIVPEVVESGHGGGDHSLVREFLQLLRDNHIDNDANALKSAEGHMIAFAAEQSRVTGQTIQMDQFMKEIRKKSQRI